MNQPAKPFDTGEPLVSPNEVRPTLGSYISLSCFRYMQAAAEEVCGNMLPITAGRERGRSLYFEYLGGGLDLKTSLRLKTAIGELLGANGMRLCLLQDVKRTVNGYLFYVQEAADCAGIEHDEPFCTYTLGVFVGLVEGMTGRRAEGIELECAAMGSHECIYRIEFM
jgi:predicted hydrocarbon binding protein